jgi:hypothetical protein
MTCTGGGLWNAIAHELPGHIATSVLVQDQSPDLYLILQFYSSTAAAIAAAGSPKGKLLFDVLARLADRTSRLGVFSFCSDASFDHKSVSSPDDGLSEDWRSST